MHGYAVALGGTIDAAGDGKQCIGSTEAGAERETESESEGGTGSDGKAVVPATTWRRRR